MSMASGKLHLKRTPAEQAEREFHRAKKAARRAAKRHHHELSESSSDEYRQEQANSPPSKRGRTGHSKPSGTGAPSSDYSYVFYDSADEYGPVPLPSASASASASSSRAHKPDYDQIREQLEEERFREKMFGAMEEDERLDGLESHLNSYAHIPRRWRGGGMDRMDDELGIDPQLMEEEDYAEWVRAGMWRRKHAEEYAEQERKKAERAARRAREKAIRDETKRLERAEDEDRERHRRSRERRRAVEVREQYDARWRMLLASGEDGILRFADVPWPVMPPDLSNKRSTHHWRISIEHLTVEAISAFLLPPGESGNGEEEERKKERKEKLRETMLRFHPDKFEGRIMRRVREGEREKVKEAVGIVVRTVSGLMGEAK